MRVLSMGCLVLLVFCLCAADLQARMVVVLQQSDGVIAAVEKGKQLVTSDNVTFALANKEVSAKASQLQGQSAHILFYVEGDNKHCVDLRPAGEPAFEITAPQNQEVRQEKKARY